MKTLTTALALLFTAASAAAQTPAPVGSIDPVFTPNPVPPVVPPCIYSQPWIAPLPSFESRVYSCTQPVPFGLVAMDDFTCGSGDLVRLRFWGTLRTAQQQGKTYYVAVYSDKDCKPGELMYRTCLRPKSEYVGNDCLGQRVFQFRARLPGWPVVAGERYWLQISEVDQDSAEQGIEDFRWSSRRPPQGCLAAQRDAAGNVECPLYEPCFDSVVDMSFELMVRP